MARRPKNPKPTPPPLVLTDEQERQARYLLEWREPPATVDGEPLLAVAYLELCLARRIVAGTWRMTPTGPEPVDTPQSTAATGCEPATAGS